MYIMVISSVHMLLYYVVFSVDNKQSTLQQVDWILCLGGDGTLLFTSSLFKVSW